MICDELETFHANLDAKGALLALDVGKKRHGYAFSRPSGYVVIGSGEIVWNGLSGFMVEINRLVLEKYIMGFVMGWPRHMNGEEGENCRVVRRLAHQLSVHQEKARPILLWDERLSTKAVERAMGDKIRKNHPLDGAAAGYILQGCLDALVRLKKKH